MNTMQTIELAGKRFIIMEESEFAAIRSAAVKNVTDDGPALPKPDAAGNVPGVAYMRAGLARKIIKARKLAGLSQADLARRAGVRVETLNRIEKGRNTPDVATVEKINRALLAIRR